MTLLYQVRRPAPRSRGLLSRADSGASFRRNHQQLNRERCSTELCGAGRHISAVLCADKRHRHGGGAVDPRNDALR